jgi:hypothetical protein
VIVISITLTRIVFYDPNSAEAEKVLQELDNSYKLGKKLTDKEFDLYCFLLRKIRKIKLLECVCRDGVSNKTPRIDWTHPPKSPQSLDSEWMEITREEVKKKSYVKTTLFLHKITGEKIAFDKGDDLGNAFKNKDHWHRFNPNAKNKNNTDLYLDECGKPVEKGSKESHIFIEE